MTDATNIGTGNETLDQILGGGLTRQRIYLIDGSPGAGKTTLGIGFLLEGVRKGESGLYVTLSETRTELQGIAESHGWSLDGLSIYELVDPSDSLDTDAHYTMFKPSEVELGQTTRGLIEEVERLNPKRVVVDSLSELRLLAQSPLRYRRQILALKHFFATRDCTAIFLDDKTSTEEDLQLQSIAHGVLTLDRVASEFGDERRKLRVVKFRGRQYVGGWHDFVIERGGVRVFSRIGASQQDFTVHDRPRLASGNASLDRLLGEGIERGTSTLLLGPAGVGKSSCATLFAATACRRGERAAVFAFDETKQTLMSRSKGLGMDLEAFEREGLLDLHQVNPGDITPGQFADMVRSVVRPKDGGEPVSVLVIDSLNGYLSSMPEERFLQIQMHELLNYLSVCGVATFLVVAQAGMLGAAMNSPVDASYLADTVLLFRYFEAGGEIRQAISVVKKRDGRHERSIREFKMTDGQIMVGTPLVDFQGILAGTPQFVGDIGRLITERGSDAQP